MAGISFSGVASGLDTGSIVQQLVALRRQPILRYEDKKNDLQRSISALSDLRSAVDKLRKAAEGLDTESEFTSRAARVAVDLAHIPVRLVRRRRDLNREAPTRLDQQQEDREK